jgi:putative transposase
MDLGERAGRFKFLIHDGDSKSATVFDEVFAANGTRVIWTPARSPRANAFAERFVGTLRRECLDHILILGDGHLRKALAEFARHYNGHRPFPLGGMRFSASTTHTAPYAKPCSFRRPAEGDSSFS